jgi:hypothetical protein
LFEGGSGDEDLNDEDGAETVKPKGKKKKKKKSKRTDTLKSKDTGVTQKLDEPAYNPDTQGEGNPLQPIDEMVIDDFDNKTEKTKKSKRSVSKKKSLKKKGTEKSEG